MIRLELDTRSIQLASLGVTWRSSSGSKKEEYHAICWSDFEIAEKPKQGVGIAVRNTLRPCVEQPLIASFRLRKDANTQRKEHQICTCNRQATIEITSSTTFTLLLPVLHHILQVLPECGFWDREAINGHSADS